MDLSRREFVKTAVAGSLAAGTAGLLSGCGISAAPAASSAPVASGPPRRGGTLRAAITGGSTADTLDPLDAITNADFSRVDNLYEPLVGLTPDAQAVLVLADEVTPNADATEWTVRLSQGITFHNGKDLTADDVIYTFQTIINPKAPAAAAAGLSSIDAKGITKLDSLTLRIPCTTPFAIAVRSAGHSRLLRRDPGRLQPRGPGRHRRVQAAELHTRHAEHFRPLRRVLADRPALPGRDSHHRLRDATSQVNALLAGQADVVNLLSADVIAVVESQGKKILISDGGGWNPFTMRVDVAPFNDVRVRQAMRLVVDRLQMLEILFGGTGTLGNDVFGIWAPEYDHALPQRHQDIDQAKSLLKAAGARGSHGRAGHARTSPRAPCWPPQVLAQQASAGRHQRQRPHT